MADTKISALTALTGANVQQTSDILPLVDTSVTTTKKILISELSLAQNVLMTEQASTSGTSIDFTGIPAWAQRIAITFEGVSTSGTSILLVQLGDAGGFETSGYLGASTRFSASGVTTQNHTAGFGIPVENAANILHGTITITLKDATNFTWVASGVLSTSTTTNSFITSGVKSTSAALTQVRITTTNGSDTFDLGSINVLYS
jgi:hypothetical protein